MPRRVLNGRPKHKMEVTKYQETIDFEMGAIRNKVLQKVVLLNFNIFILPLENNPLRQGIEERLRAKNVNVNHRAIAWEITPEEVMKVLLVSRRTAQEYKRIMQVMKS
jgi:hypothetical protein